MSALPSRLEGWKVAIAVGAAVAIAPVVVLVLLVLLVALLPALPFLPILFVGFWRSNHRPPRSTPAPLVFRPPMGHPVATRSPREGIAIRTDACIRTSTLPGLTSGKRRGAADERGVIRLAVTSFFRRPARGQETRLARLASRALRATARGGA
jgi:hypothetical protein